MRGVSMLRPPLVMSWSEVNQRLPILDGPLQTSVGSRYRLLFYLYLMDRRRPSTTTTFGALSEAIVECRDLDPLLLYTHLQAAV